MYTKVDYAETGRILTIVCMKTYPQKWTRTSLVSALSAGVITLSVAVSPAYAQDDTRTAPPGMPEGWTASAEETDAVDEGVQTRSGANWFFCQYVDPFYC